MGQQVHGSLEQYINRRSIAVVVATMLVALAGLAAVSGPAAAQDGGSDIEVTVNVEGSSPPQPAEGVTVMIVSGAEGTPEAVTDSQGTATLTDVRTGDGPLSLRLQYDGNSRTTSVSGASPTVLAPQEWFESGSGPSGPGDGGETPSDGGDESEMGNGDTGDNNGGGAPGAGDGGSSVDPPSSDGSALSQLESAFVWIATVLAWIAGSLALLFFIWGIIEWMSAGASMEREARGRKRIIISVVGAALSAMSFVIIEIIESGLGIRQPTMNYVNPSAVADVAAQVAAVAVSLPVL